MQRSKKDTATTNVNVIDKFTDRFRAQQLISTLCPLYMQDLQKQNNLYNPEMNSPTISCCKQNTNKEA